MKRILILMAVLACNAAYGQTPVALYQPQVCQGGQCQTCGPVQTVAYGVVTYAGNVGQAIVQPVRGLFPRLAEWNQTRPRLFGRCR